jgi:hypothetical protein
MLPQMPMLSRALQMARLPGQAVPGLAGGLPPGLAGGLPPGLGDGLPPGLAGGLPGAMPRPGIGGPPAGPLIGAPAMGQLPTTAAPAGQPGPDGSPWGRQDTPLGMPGNRARRFPNGATPNLSPFIRVRGGIPQAGGY